MRRLPNKSQLIMAMVLGGVLLTGSSAYAATVVNSQPENATTETKIDAVQPATDANGVVVNGWDATKKSYYRDGVKVKGFNWIDDNLYYFDQQGSLYSNTGFQVINGSTYYVQSNYSIGTGICKIDGDAYYFDTETGVMSEETGVVKQNGNYYYFDEDSVLQSGWCRDDDGKRYYFSPETYTALTGWNYVGKYKFYFKKNGQLVQDVRKKLTKQQKESYYIRVNRKGSCVTVYAKDYTEDGDDNGYTVPVIAFVCSAGNHTPKGNFKIKDKLRWHELDGPSWGQWCEHLTTDILFHSVYYDRERDNKSLNVKAYNKLGTVASHGCIRLRAGDAKWIYDNCDVGTKVTIYDNKKVPGPFDQPKAQKLSAGHTWDPTDPAFKGKK